ncbi:hypothetical protein ACA910_007822 [Epithemia clementina (nom. ined.)]
MSVMEAAGGGGDENTRPEANAKATATTTTTTTKLVDDPALRSLLCPFSMSELGDNPNHQNNANNNNHSTNLTAGGGAASWERLVKSITTHHQSVLLPPYTMTMTLYIATASVGAVIGRRGQTVANLQKSAAQVASTHQPVRVSVVAATKEGLGNTTNTNNNTTNGEGLYPQQAATTMTATTVGPPMTPGSNHNIMNNSGSDYHTYTPLDWSDPAWTPVVIRADAPAVCHAALGLVELLSKAPGAPMHHNTNNNNNNNNSNGSSSSSSNPTALLQNSHLLMDQVVLDVPLARQKHATLVGKRGQTLATFSAETAVRIMIPQKNTPYHYHRHPNSQHPSSDLIQLEGDLWNVLVCLANLMSWLVQPPSLLATNNHTLPPAAAAAANSNNNNNNTKTAHEGAAKTATSGSSNHSSNHSSSGNNNNNNNHNNNHNHSSTTTTALAAAVVTTTTTASVSLLALPSQTKLRNIARKTDCQIRKQRKSNTLTVTGSNADHVQLAVQLLQKWQAAQQQQQQQQSSGSNHNNNNNAADESGATPPRRQHNAATITMPIVAGVEAAAGVDEGEAMPNVVVVVVVEEEATTTKTIPTITTINFAAYALG